MPTYEFECEQCQIAFETILGINDLHIGECPLCDKLTNKRIFSPFTVINKTPSTIGSLADTKRSSMGSYEYDDTVQKMANERKVEFCGKLPEGCEQIKPTTDRPWWRTDKATPDYGLLKATPEKINDYVITGKRPAGTT